MKKYLKSEAFTGLEAAIVLIAFVVVAAVFSYVVLGAGFFTTQKAQQVIYSGVQQASSNIIIIGEVYGNSTVNPPVIDSILFSIGLAAGGSSIDLNKTVFTYQNSTTLRTLDFASGNASGLGPRCDSPGAVPPGPWQWCIVKAQNADDDSLLEKNEQFTIQANLQSDTAGGLPPSEDFTLTIRPDIGAALPIHKTAPGGLSAMNILY
jgi:archaeal flagellin FlaB